MFVYIYVHAYICLPIPICNIFGEKEDSPGRYICIYIYICLFCILSFYLKYVSAFSSCLSTEIVILFVCLFAFLVVA